MNKVTVLVIEDNEDIADCIKEQLEDNYNVVVAHNIEKAKELINNNDVKCVVSDLNLDNGDESHLSLAGSNNIPLVIVSGENEKHLTVKIHAWIKKPILSLKDWDKFSKEVANAMV